MEFYWRYGIGTGWGTCRYHTGRMGFVQIQEDSCNYCPIWWFSKVSSYGYNLGLQHFLLWWSWNKQTCSSWWPRDTVGRPWQLQWQAPWKYIEKMNKTKFINNMHHRDFKSIQNTDLSILIILIIYRHQLLQWNIHL